ncbi:MAG: hypothetical protein AAB838_01565 [Patescibacteria group bacterium]
MAEKITQFKREETDDETKPIDPHGVIAMIAPQTKYLQKKLEAKGFGDKPTKVKLYKEGNPNLGEYIMTVTKK